MKNKIDRAVKYYGMDKKKAEKEMNKKQAVTMNQNFYFSYFR